MFNILVTVPVSEAQKSRLMQAAGDNKLEYCKPTDVTRELIDSADILFGNVSPALVDGAKSLKLLQLFTAGTDGYVPVLPKGCIMTNTTGAFGLAISEHMLGMTLALMKRLHQYRDNQARHEWKDMGGVTSVEDAYVLVIGLGDIGGEYARKCKALGAYTVGVRRRDASVPVYMDEVHLADELDALIPKADVIAMAMPGMKETYHTMDARRIGLMKPGAILINVGRGGAVDCDALADAIETRGIKAGLDVTEPEPLPPSHKLWGLENALITPHISGFFHLPQTLDRMVDIACFNIAAFAEGRPLKNVIDLQTGYKNK